MVENRGGIPASSAEAWWHNMLDPLRGAASRISDFFSPPAEAFGNDQFYEIHVELPGIEEKDIDISVDDRTITVKGERSTETVKEGKTYFFSERSYGRFQRSFRLPVDADEDKIHASFKNGLLTIKIAKASPEAKKGQKIPINAG